ncbi:hypothetical protein DSL72_001212 [Monilinia vaccinii-corymbosi]|uniref:Pre-mRNA-splicing factor SPF27 n=1 Tax=Monilinia vaccinii-corymbosi TaxID=61207 RepID=A0A8A3P172_9HELO|nr:hypothetical protein DSL72_001212 [Monilinia vaccinii-corymbosi]
MPLINEIHESLPYIDAEPTPAERTAAESLIATYLEPTSASTPHPSLPPLLPSHLSPALATEHARISHSTPAPPLKAIDLTRYETLSPSESSLPASTLLSQAYTSQTYLNTRLTNLSLLEQFGRNAWLIGNAQLEDILKGLEQEVAAKKDEIDVVVIGRKNAQEAVEAEIKGLEDGWKKGVGRVLETEVAAEGVRREILVRRRAGAS